MRGCYIPPLRVSRFVTRAVALPQRGAPKDTCTASMSGDRWNSALGGGRDFANRTYHFSVERIASNALFTLPRLVRKKCARTAINRVASIPEQRELPHVHVGRQSAQRRFSGRVQSTAIPKIFDFTHISRANRSASRMSWPSVVNACVVGFACHLAHVVVNTKRHIFGRHQGCRWTFKRV